MVPVVARVVGEMVEAFGWPSMLLVFFNDGVTRRVAEEVMAQGKGCVLELLNLQLNYLESPAFQVLDSVFCILYSVYCILYSVSCIAFYVFRILYSVFQRLAFHYSQPGTRVLLVAESPDQVPTLQTSFFLLLFSSFFFFFFSNKVTPAFLLSCFYFRGEGSSHLIPQK